MTSASQPVTVQGIDCGHEPGFGLEDLLRNADVLSGSNAILKKINSGKYAAQILPLSLPLDTFIENMGSLAQNGKKVVILADGDPLFFGIGANIARQLGSHMADIRPAVSSMQMACARIGLPWHNMAFISLHGREDLRPLFAAIANNSPICVLTGTGAGPDFVARFMLDRGYAEYVAHIFENLGKQDEHCLSMRLDECASTVFPDCITLILVPTLPSKPKRVSFDNCDLIGDYATQKPIRGAILELLNITPRDTVWDIGSGTGAMALEFSSRAYAGNIIAVEEKIQRALNIQQNRKKFGGINIKTYFGHAPDCLAQLPVPDKVFIGGGLSGSDGMRLVQFCADTLAPGGILAASCILLESFDSMRNFLHSLNWQMECCQIQFSSTRRLGKGEYLSPADPVFLLSAAKPAKE